MMRRQYLNACRDPEVRQVLLMDGPRVLPQETVRGNDLGLAMLAVELDVLIAAGLVMPVPSAAMARLIMGALDRAALSIAEHPGDEALHVALATSLHALFEGLRTKAGPLPSES